MNSKILSALAFLVALAIIFGYVRPAMNGQIAQAKAAIDFDNQALDAAAQYQAEQTSLAAARDAIDPSNLARLSQFLPDSVDNVRLILDLNGVASRSGLSLSNVDVLSNTPVNGAQSAQPIAITADKTVGTLNLTLAAAGTFGALQTFLSSVEHSARLLDVQDLVVKGSDTGVYTYDMTIRLYWLR